MEVNGVQIESILRLIEYACFSVLPCLSKQVIMNFLFINFSERKHWELSKSGTLSRSTKQTEHRPTTLLFDLSANIIPELVFIDFLISML